MQGWPARVGHPRLRARKRFPHPSRSSRSSESMVARPLSDLEKACAARSFSPCTVYSSIARSECSIASWSFAAVPAGSAREFLDLGTLDPRSRDLEGLLSEDERLVRRPERERSSPRADERVARHVRAHRARHRRGTTGTPRGSAMRRPRRARLPRGTRDTRRPRTCCARRSRRRALNTRPSRNHALQEPVLAALGRSRIEIDREKLPPDEVTQDRLELALLPLGDRAERRHGEALPENRCVLDEPTLFGRKRVES